MKTIYSCLFDDKMSVQDVLRRIATDNVFAFSWPDNAAFEVGFAKYQRIKAHLDHYYDVRYVRKDDEIMMDYEDPESSIFNDYGWPT